MKKKFHFFTWLLDKRELAMALLVLLMAVVLALTTDSFLTGENISNILKQASITVVLACGMTFVISGGGIDLSIASNTRPSAARRRAAARRPIAAPQVWSLLRSAR